MKTITEDLRIEKKFSKRMIDRHMDAMLLIAQTIRHEAAVSAKDLRVRFELGMGHEAYDRMIRVLTKCGDITEREGCLIWNRRAN